MKCLSRAIVLGVLAGVAVLTASNNAIIIQGLTPTEAAGLDWAPQDVDTLDELWNDCFLAFEMFCARPGIDTTPGRIHMLWGKGGDFGREGARYDPWGRLELDSITDDSACIATVESVFGVLSQPGRMTESDTLFCYTWGHGGHNYSNPHTPSKASHFSIGVRPLHTDLWDTTFARMADPIPGTRVFVMQQCFGGGFIDDLGDERTYIYCATAAGQQASSADNRSRLGSPLPEHETTGVDVLWRHSEFNFHFMNALRGQGIWPYASPPLVDADYDGNGDVTWWEAFRYNELHESSKKDEPVFCQPDSAWRSLSPMPDPPGNRTKPVGYGGSLACAFDDSGRTVIYALKGNGTRQFWSYRIENDSWAVECSVPEGPRQKRVKKGAALCFDGERYIYALKGWRTGEFYAYDIQQQEWNQMAGLPDGHNARASDGSDIESALVGEDRYVYCLKGGRSKDKPFEFWRYSVERDSWDSMPVPGPLPTRSCRAGSAIACVDDSLLYLLVGGLKATLRNGSDNFYAFDTRANTWTAKKPLITEKGRVKDGGGLCHVPADRALYATAGKSAACWRYLLDEDRWERLPDVPAFGLSSSKAKLRKGADIECANGIIYALRGNMTYGFMRLVPTAIPGQAPTPPTEPVALPPLDVPVVCLPDGSAPRWAPDGQLIAYSALDSTTGYLDIFICKPTGGQPLPLTGLAADCEAPRWSPDGKTIVFQLFDREDGYYQLATTDLEGNIKVLTSAAEDHEQPVFMPDGSQVVYLRDDEDGYQQLWSIAVGGGTEQPLTTGEADRANPETYLHGSTVGPVPAVLHQKEDADGYWQVHALVLHPSGAVDLPLTSDMADHEHPCRYASSNAAYAFVVYSKQFDDGGSQVCLRPDGSTCEVVLFQDKACALSWPTISPDGLRVSFVRAWGANSELAEVPTNGSWQAHSLTDQCDIYDRPQYSPLDSTIAVEFYPLGLAGGGAQSGGRAVPNASRLESILPNPIGTRALIHYTVSSPGVASFCVYDVNGRLVRTLASGQHRPGRYQVTWNGTDDAGARLAGGVYFCRLDVHGTSQVRKAVLTR